MEYYKRMPMPPSAPGSYVLKKLNRTGSCKIVTTDGVDREYVEHKGWFFRSWINVENIIVQSVQIYDCENGHE